MNIKNSKRKRIVLNIVLFIITFPSIVLGLSMVYTNVFASTVNEFVKQEVENENRNVVGVDIDVDEEIVTFTFIGESVKDAEIKKLEADKSNYGLEEYEINIIQNE